MAEEKASAKVICKGADMLYKKRQFEEARICYAAALERAREQEDTKILTQCLLKLGDFAFVGFGKEPDYEKAMAYYSEAYELGDVAGANNMGYMYLNGKGTEVDKPKAIELFKVAADHNSPMGIHNLAYCYQYGYEGLIEQDVKLSYQLYKKASKMGYKLSTDALKMFNKDRLGHITLKESAAKAPEEKLEEEN